MASEREIKKLLKPLLARHGDLALVGRMIVVLPLRTHLRAIFIDRTSSAELLNPRWFIHHLCTPKLWCHLSWGERLIRKSHGLWTTTNPETPRVLQEEIELNALPFLRTIVSFEDYVAAIGRHECSHLISKSPETKVVIDAALGKLDAMREVCHARGSYFAEFSTSNCHEITLRAMEGARRLCNLVAKDDRGSLIRTLREWEEETVKRYKLEHLWERTALPIGMMAA